MGGKTSYTTTLLLLILLILGGAIDPIVCIAQKKTIEPKVYEEDLSSVRSFFAPPVEAPREKPTTSSTAPTKINKTSSSPPAPNATNKKVNAVIDSIAQLHKALGYTDGYTIQIYIGKNKQEAVALRSKVAETLTNETLQPTAVILKYDQPNFLVTAGHYFSPLAAQFDLLRIKKQFPKSILIPEKIPLDIYQKTP